MTIGIKVKYYWFQIGNGEFLHAFFSNICFHLENQKWGSKYPTVMKDLYSGHLGIEKVSSAISEIEMIKTELDKIAYQEVIWDIEDLSKEPPWGSNISESITSLGDYFITSEGDDLISHILNALRKAEKLKCDIKIESI